MLAMADRWLTTREIAELYGVTRQTTSSRLRRVTSRKVRRKETGISTLEYPADEAITAMDAAEERKRTGMKLYRRCDKRPACTRCGIVLVEAEAMWGPGDERYCHVCREELRAGHVVAYWESLREEVA